MSLQPKDEAFENDLNTTLALAKKLGLLSPILERELFLELQYINKSEFKKESEKLIKQGEINILKQLNNKGGLFIKKSDMSEEIEKRIKDIGLLQGEINGLQAYRFRLRHRWEQVILDLRNAVRSKSVKSLKGMDEKEIKKIKETVKELNLLEENKT